MWVAVRRSGAVAREIVSRSERQNRDHHVPVGSVGGNLGREMASIGGSADSVRKKLFLLGEGVDNP